MGNTLLCFESHVDAVAAEQLSTEMKVFRSAVPTSFEDNLLLSPKAKVLDPGLLPQLKRAKAQDALEEAKAIKGTSNAAKPTAQMQPHQKSAPGTPCFHKKNKSAGRAPPMIRCPSRKVAIASSTPQLGSGSKPNTSPKPTRKRASRISEWETMELLREAFSVVDVSNSGLLDLCGFVTCLRAMGLEMELDQAEKLFNAISEGYSTVSFQDLHEYLTSHSCGCPLLNRVKRHVQDRGFDDNYLVFSMVRTDAPKFIPGNDLLDCVLRNQRLSELEQDNSLMNELSSEYTQSLTVY